MKAKYFPLIFLLVVTFHPYPACLPPFTFTFPAHAMMTGVCDSNKSAHEGSIRKREGGGLGERMSCVARRPLTTLLLKEREGERNERVNGLEQAGFLPLRNVVYLPLPVSVCFQYAKIVVIFSIY
jgi:hypothetical protein